MRPGSVLILSRHAPAGRPGAEFPRDARVSRGRRPIVSVMRAVLIVVLAVIAVIVVLKVIAAVSALVLAFVPAIIALGGGYAVGQIHGARRERRKLEAKRGGQLPK